MNLRIPGPTPLPQNVLDSMSRQIINHRGPEAQTLVAQLTAAMRQIIGASGDVYLMNGSGWTGVESAIVNTLMPGDRVLCLSAGSFGEEFARIARIYGADVEVLTFPDGAAIDPDAVRAQLRAMRDVRAVLLTQNESFTGVAHALREIAAVVRAESDALMHVDAVSATGALETQLDAWGVDTICTASQKALMGPPGMAIVALSERAYTRSLACTIPRYTLNWKQFRAMLQANMTPTTCALPVMYALATAADMIMQEGLSNVYARHERVAAHTRARVRALGLELFAQPGAYSPALTAVAVPAGIDGDDLRERTRARGAELGGGWDRLKGKILRIGHMGLTSEAEIDHAVDVLGEVLAEYDGMAQ
jgi:aspartate aminotransferase-like enzyme